tara:strand:- start:134 stop:376 length:243 start_codon:yes stop_codon:yes gene_type:complete
VVRRGLRWPAISGLVSTWARASLVSDIEASLVIEASSAVPEPRGAFIWVPALLHGSSAQTTLPPCRNSAISRTTLVPRLR